MSINVTIYSEDGDNYAVIDLGNREYATSFFVKTLPSDCRCDIYVDHEHNGSGTDNWQFDAFGKELDLEFCRSRPATDEEVAAMQAAIVQWNKKCV